MSLAPILLTRVMGNLCLFRCINTREKEVSWEKVTDLCRPEMVEGGSMRYGQLAYVAAFSGGGAKDVTSRYLSQRDKIRHHGTQIATTMGVLAMIATVLLYRSITSGRQPS
jgi:hypothetical protein